MTDKKTFKQTQEDPIVDQGLNHLADMQGRFILKNKVPVPFEGEDSEYDEWVADDKNCVVERTTLGDTTILTEFFGNVDIDNPDNHFWTILSHEAANKYPDLHKVKYKTWEAAEKGHNRVVGAYQEREENQ